MLAALTKTVWNYTKIQCRAVHELTTYVQYCGTQVKPSHIATTAMQDREYENEEALRS
jgi:hypothetical protein